jgi:AraC-like DNA-binding protein
MYEYEIQDRRRSRKAPSGVAKKREIISHRRADKATVVTVLEARMRTSVDGATDSTFTNVHVDSVAEAFMAVKEHAPRALLLSTAVVQQQALSEIARLVMKNPGVLPVAVACSDGPVPGELLLSLGACGVRRFLDLNGRGGWEGLRGLLDGGGGETEAVILRTLLPQLREASDESRHFFAALVRRAPSTVTVRALAKVLGISASTLMSRFFRASIPSPKSYLSMTRLLYAAAFFERKAISIADVANSLNFSSPQSFGRHVRLILGLTAGEFRRDLSLPEALDHYVARLIVPHRDVFRSFNPLGPGYLRDSNELPRDVLLRDQMIA